MSDAVMAKLVEWFATACTACGLDVTTVVLGLAGLAATGLSAVGVWALKKLAFASAKIGWRATKATCGCLYSCFCGSKNPSQLCQLILQAMDHPKVRTLPQGYLEGPSLMVSFKASTNSGRLDYVKIGKENAMQDAWPHLTRGERRLVTRKANAVARLLVANDMAEQQANMMGALVKVLPTSGLSFGVQSVDGVSASLTPIDIRLNNTHAKK